jgi:hypothetical protein
MRGPKNTPNDCSGELYLHVILTPDGGRELGWNCTRRKVLAI